MKTAAQYSGRPKVLRIERSTEGEILSRTCAELISLLPNWFGLPEANQNYIQGVAGRPGFIALEGDRILGMLSLSHPYPNNADIYWMGVRPDTHRRGVGKQLFESALTQAREWGCTSLTVETLSDQHPDEGYARTRAFYAAMGFRPLFALAQAPDNPLLYMYRDI